MSPFAHLPTAVVSMVVSFLLPLLLPSAGGDAKAACALALDLLADYEPHTARELRLAAEAIAYSLKGLRLLGQSEAPDATPEAVEIAMKWAASLNRSSHPAQGRLEQLQRARRTGRTEETAQAHPRGADAPPPAPPAAVAPQMQDANPPTPDLAAAETAFAQAEQRLSQMKAHYMGAPPPHSLAAQQIRAQERALDAARMKLSQARLRQTATAPKPATDRAAA